MTISRTLLEQDIPFCERYLLPIESSLSTFPYLFLTLLYPFIFRFNPSPLDFPFAFLLFFLFLLLLLLPFFFLYSSVIIVEFSQEVLK